MHESQESLINKLNKKIITLPVSFTLNAVVEIYEKLGVKSGEVVLDPFAGAATVGLIGESYGVETINIEIDEGAFRVIEKNFATLQKLLNRPTLLAININADSEFATVSKKIDAIITSPPFTISDKTNPFADYGSYGEYYEKMTRIAKKYWPMVKPGGKAALMVGNDVSSQGVERIKDKLKLLIGELGFLLIEELPRGESIHETAWLIFEKPSD